MDQSNRRYEEGKQTVRVVAMAVHPYTSGVPHRNKYFEAAFGYMQRHQD